MSLQGEFNLNNLSDVKISYDPESREIRITFYCFNPSFVVNLYDYDLEKIIEKWNEIKNKFFPTKVTKPAN